MHVIEVPRWGKPSASQFGAAGDKSKAKEGVTLAEKAKAKKDSRRR
jgi:hypothetical protein